MDLTFVTGNQAKADYLAKLLKIEFKHQKIELDEIQSTDLSVIGEHKARQAYEILHSPVLIDDVGLGFDALEGLPGPFIKFFQEIDDGFEKLCRMLDGFDTRGAIATCTMVYYDGATLEVFEKSLKGIIANHPRGKNGFGWDVIFCPDGYNGKTRAELDEADDAATYVAIKPLQAVSNFLEQHEK